MTRERLQFLQRLLIVSDLVLTGISFVVSYFIRDTLYAHYKLDLVSLVKALSNAGFDPFTGYATLLVYVLPIWGMSLACAGTYREAWNRQGVLAGPQLLKAGVWATLVTVGVFYLLKLPYVARSYVLIFSALNLGCLYLFRHAFAIAIPKFLGSKAETRYLLVVGTGTSARAFANRIIRNPHWRMDVVGFLAQDRSLLGSTIAGIPVLGTIDLLEDILRTTVIDEVIFAVSLNEFESLDQPIHHCEVKGVRAVILATLFDVHVGRIVASEVAGWPVLMINTVSVKEWERLAKRVIDLLGASIGICLAAPVMLLIAVAIQRTSGGPILFRQERVGLNGRRFTLYKFRTMVVDAERYRDQLQAMNEMDGPVFKMARDPRVTRLGDILRRSSLDELPQLFNVWCGDMSLVGPRPPIPTEVEQYEAWQRRRLSMKPGITCVWQVNGRNKIGFRQWMAMDLEYIDNWSLKLDLKILAQTIPAVFKREGAQ
jgi:exopolysaccharide biosynthesis polyprenyl glycosylphosphotransferase